MNINMDYVNLAVALLNVIAFLIALKQVNDARKLEKNLSTRLEEHQNLLNDASTQVTQQGETQQNLLNAANIQTEEMQKQIGQIQDIRRSLTTSFIGDFPDFVPQVISLIESAEKSLAIFCDIPAYAAFTSPKYFFNYRQVIERKINQKIKVEIAFLNQEWRQRAFDEQFSKQQNDCINWNENDRAKLDNFINEFPNSLLKDNLTLEVSELNKIRLFDLIEELDLFTIKMLSNAKPLEITSNMPLLFWLKDDIEAIFAIPAYEGDIKTLGFKTSDRSLIESLKYMSFRYRQNYSHSALEQRI